MCRSDRCITTVSLTSLDLSDSNENNPNYDTISHVLHFTAGISMWIKYASIYADYFKLLWQLPLTTSAHKQEGYSLLHGYTACLVMVLRIVHVTTTQILKVLSST
jgi:hypothetical protein